MKTIYSLLMLATATLASDLPNARFLDNSKPANCDHKEEDNARGAHACDYGSND